MPRASPSRPCASPLSPGRSSRIMVNFFCLLIWNLALLAAARVTCWLVRCARPDLTPNGTRVFLGLMAIALAFDTALTFLVFADAGGSWRVNNASDSYPARACAYGFAALIALLVARWPHRHEQRKTPAASVEIETSPYSKSTLPM
jgi:hypothetical protein